MKAFALTGYPLDHSLSPLLHNLVFRQLQLPHTYFIWELVPAELASAVEMFRRNLAGFNVTAPYKREIIPHLDDLHLTAEVYGAVNTVKNEDGKLIGYNTDGYGFLKGLENDLYQLNGSHVLLLGAGGAAQTAALELAHQNCIFTIANRNVRRAHELQIFLKNRFPNVDVEVTDIKRIPKRKYKLAVNATPIGMGKLKDETPLEAPYLDSIEVVYDMIYNPQETKLLQQAKKAGCYTVNGLQMLVYQGLKASQIWLQQTIPSHLERLVVETVAKELAMHA